MNYKETLFFIAKCLTITLDDINRKAIEKQLKSKSIDWGLVVKISTTHYVFSALYCNFKRNKFLKYLPKNLVEYMKYITNLNRDRNKKIIRQAKALNSLLLDNEVKPIFLKGTGNLLEGLYEDIGERIVTDIDFLCSEKDFLMAIDILKDDNYLIPKKSVDFFPGYRHYPSLVKKKNIAAVEIHKEVIIEKYRAEFNYKIISENTQMINDYCVLSFEDQLSLSIITSQINDYGWELENFSLRNAYDVFLLSKKVDTKKAFSRFNRLKNPLICFLANCNLVFGNIDTLGYTKTKESESYSLAFNNSFKKRKSNSKKNFKILKVNFERRFNILCKSIFNMKNRKWLLNRIKRRIKI